MFKFVVLCAFVAAAVADPGLLAPAIPLTYSSPLLTPATTAYTYQPSSYIQPSQYLYSAPFAYSHFIKKRSTHFITPTTYSYISPGYIAPAPVAAPVLKAPVLSTPVWAGAPLTYAASAHYIKKRSVAFPLPSTYIAPSTYFASAPLATTYSTAYSTPLIHSAPYLSAAPLTYTAPAHFIKKRSVAFPLPSTYIAPTTYHTASAPFYASTYSAAAPFISSPFYSTGPFAYSTFIKK